MSFGDNMREYQRFNLGDIVKHKYQNNHGYIFKVHSPYYAVLNPHNEAYTVIWFNEDLNDRLRYGYDQIELGDIIVKVS
jgi:heat shock protein HspQ